jgi:hypothetical protein
MTGRRHKNPDLCLYHFSDWLEWPAAAAAAAA